MARGRRRNNPKNTKNNGATLGFEATLWAAADKLRNNMDAAEYKHVVLGLIFLKYISDAFEERHAELLWELDLGADPEDPDEYRAENIFWVPKEARWSFLQANAKQATIGRNRRRRNGCYREGQPLPKGRPSKGLRPPCP